MNTNIFTVTPMSQKVNLHAGDTYEGDITVANPANATDDFHYKVEISGYGIINDEDKGDYGVNFLTESERVQIAKWIKIDNPKGVLKPNETTKVHFVVKVPESAPAGGQYAAFLISSDNEAAVSEGVAINNVFEIASILYAGISGDVRHDGEILDTYVPGFVTATPIATTASLSNHGNIHENARITLQVKNFFTSETIYPKEGENDTIEEVIMPETTRYVSTRNIDSVAPLGIYRVKQTVNYMGNVDINDIVVVSCPIWFMALVLLTIAAIVTTIVFSIKRHRRKKQIF